MKYTFRKRIHCCLGNVSLYLLMTYEQEMLQTEFQMKKNVPDKTMVPLPGGCLVLRDNRIGRTWNAAIKPFLCAKYPVVQKVYHQILGENPSVCKGDDLPVETVSWYDAVRFCNALSEHNGMSQCYRIVDTEQVERIPGTDGFRLLTDAEWEYACRAGSGKSRYGELDEIAWYKANAHGRPHPAGEKLPNQWGLYDMIGNVWEWCEDVYDAQAYGTYRIFRGGGWNDPERGCLATNRRRSHPTFAIDDLGFRVARSIQSF